MPSIVKQHLRLPSSVNKYLYNELYIFLHDETKTAKSFNKSTTSKEKANLIREWCRHNDVLFLINRTRYTIYKC